MPESKPSTQSPRDQQAAEIAAVEAALGGIQVEIQSTGELTALMARLPANTLVTVTDHVRAQDGQVPERTAPFEPYHRAVEALHLCDVRRLFDSYGELLEFVAAGLVGDLKATVHELLEDEDLRGQLSAEGARLRHSAGRLTALRTQIDTCLVAAASGARERGQ